MPAVFQQAESAAKNLGGCGFESHQLAQTGNGPGTLGRPVKNHGVARNLHWVRHKG